MKRPTRIIAASSAAMAIALIATGCSAGGADDPDGTVTITFWGSYGNGGNSAQQDVLESTLIPAFEKAHPNVDVQWVDMGSQDVLDRLRSEAANPQADIWFGAPAEVFERAAAAGLLAAYRPTWAAVVPPEGKGEGDLWYGTYLTPEVIACIERLGLYRVAE